MSGIILVYTPWSQHASLLSAATSSQYITKRLLGQVALSLSAELQVHPSSMARSLCQPVPCQVPITRGTPAQLFAEIAVVTNCHYQLLSGSIDERQVFTGRICVPTCGALVQRDDRAESRCYHSTISHLRPHELLHSVFIHHFDPQRRYRVWRGGRSL